MRQIAASGARFVITTGDNGYPSGSQRLWRPGAERAGAERRVRPNVLGSRRRVDPALPGDRQSRPGQFHADHPQILAFPQDRAVASSGGRYVKDSYCCLNGTSPASYASAWYAFDAGNARFYVLHAGLERNQYRPERRVCERLRLTGRRARRSISGW